MIYRPISMRRATASGLLLALWLTSGAALAQDDKRAAQLREAARAAQAAAQQAQQELSSVKGERDRLAQEDQARQSELAKVQAQGRSAAGKAAKLSTELAETTAERDRLKADLANAQAAQEALKQQLDKAVNATLATSQTLEEQRRVTQALSALLERSVKSLAAAEEANRQLLGLGLQAVKAYESSTPEAQRASMEPFMGLGTVRITNDAELLRQAMAQQQVVK